ncbi:hypothetical protein HII36_00425 [Nonomuraea sp. NN258]|uniref:CGNR zinc finger domain-containing protein n=1 Tax=Nonomuraea antri TaxID=2730852 RepID=UPI001569FC18|nr:CGNR zinc finger domain-containing protein [Nonomuraea antri]NRQ30309.1 hypothetical protein [Nonomuraea antri]
MRLRPLRTEPVALDLVDTVWVEHATLLDQFDDLAGVRAWLADHDLPGEADERMRDRLAETRAALRDQLEGRGPDRLNAVLAHGSRRPQVGAGGRAHEVVIVADESWRTAWTVAAAFADLMGERGERVRKCANPECVLWFLDVSKNGSRRWCSMEACGNRAKVGRFHQRAKSAP